MKKSAVLILILTMVMGMAWATVDPVSQPDNYSAVLYDNTNGLPTAEANAIVQTSEGFIWIGSYGGLIRYDGNTFVRMDSTNGGVASVVSLFVDSRDRLWIGTNDSGLALMENGKLITWGEDDGLGSYYVCTVAEDRNGTIYVGTTKGIYMVDPDDLSLSHFDDPKVDVTYIENIECGIDGLLYCLTNDDDLFTIKDGVLADYYDHEVTGGITSILPDPHYKGLVYIATSDGGFYYGDLNDFSSMKKTDISPLSDVMDIQKFSNQIWVCARNGIGVIYGNAFYYMDDFPMDNSVNQVISDYEGNLWFTSARKGVMKVVSNQFSDLFVRYNLDPEVVNSTCMLDGNLFLGTDTGLIILGKDSALTSFPVKSAKSASGADLGSTDLLELLRGIRIRSILRDSKNRLWISTWRGSKGLLRYDNGVVTSFTSEDGLLSDQVRAISEAADGSIMVACPGGVSIISGDKVIKSYGEADGITNTATLTVLNAPNGDILLGSDGGGIFVISKDGSVRNIGTREGLSSGIVMRISHDRTRNLFWIVASNSVSYMTEDYQVTTVENFPYSNNLDLYENSKGDIWVLSSNGIYVISANELVANGEIKPVHYGIANGLPCITTSNSYSELTEDGDLYLSGTTGVAKVNIESSLEDVSDLKQAVPFVDADGVRIYPDKSGTFTIPSSVQKLIVYGFVYNYSLTDPQVSYRLKDFDREAVTVNRSDLGPVSYTNLPGGTYIFELELKDALGRGSNVLAVTIVKEKAFYEQAWFYIFIVLASVTILALLVGMYVRKRMNALEEKHREEANRERIEGELKMANRIQSGMLPHEFPPFPDRTEFDIFASMKPAKEIGGDFYDYFFVDDDHLCMVIADVSGKGVPAALFMMVSKAIIQSVGGMCPSAAEILTKANESICANNQEEMFVTVWIGILELSTGKLTAANAGHEYPAIKQPGEKFVLLNDKHGFVVGGMKGVKYKEYELQLKPGAKIFVYTDGVAEATDSNNELFGTDRMIEALNKNPDAKPEEVLENVRAGVADFVKDAEQFDDMTMLCLEYHPDKQ